MNDAITDQVRQLELKLLHSDIKVMPSLLDALLATEFEEIGGNGAVNSRQEVVGWLWNKNSQDRWSLTDFRVRELSTDLVLAIYHAEKVVGQKNIVSKGSIRSSIWKRNTQGWQMVFHQASRII